MSSELESNLNQIKVKVVPPSNANVYEFEGFRLDAGHRMLYRNGEELSLTPKQVETLLALVERSGEIVTKEEMMTRLWGDAAVEESNLIQNIYILRKILGEARSGKPMIETLRRRGYRFSGELKESSPNPAQAVPTTDSKRILPFSVVNDHTIAQEKAAVWFPDKGKVIAALGVITILLIAVGSWLLLKESSSPAAIKSLVVLPLENLSGDPSQEYFTDGMTDALIGELARVDGLQVISRTSAMHYKGSRRSLREIADELKVDVVIEGTVQRSGDRVLIRAQLIQAATDKHLLSETYERDVSDVLSLQKEIAQAIVREIQIKINPAQQARLTSARPVNRKAFDDYLQGRFMMSRGRTEENLYKAIAFYESALKEDPTYAPAYAGLADCYNFLGTVIVSALPPLEARRLAEEAAVKALAIDSEMAEAHAALGYVKHYNWDWAGAEQELKRAIELNPNYANAHNFYAGYLVSMGRMEEAIAEISRAQALDPFSLAISAQRGFILENARRYDEAIEQLRRVIAMDPNHFQAHWYLGHTYAANGQLAEAVEESEKAVAISRTPGALGFLGMHYGLVGRKAEAEKILNELTELNRHRYVTPAAFIHVYLGLGDKQKAYFWLEKAFEHRANYMVYLRTFPGNDSLRSDPRFNDILRRMGLEP